MRLRDWGRAFHNPLGMKARSSHFDPLRFLKLDNFAQFRPEKRPPPLLKLL
jgi:hypothetical protein